VKLRVDAAAVATAADAGQGLTLVNIFAQPELFLSLKLAKHPNTWYASAHVELKTGRV
jgi:hypothetical protein